MMPLAAASGRLWQSVSQQIRMYREVAPLIGLAFALWKRWQWHMKAREASEALRQGRFMQQCAVLLVNLDGLRKPADPADVVPQVSVPMLFSRTLRTLMFENEQMVELVSEAASQATDESPLLELGADGWLVMANINAHLMEACGTFGHVAAACGRSVEIVEFIFGLVNDRTTTSRQQLRVYIVKESDLRQLPEVEDLDLRRGSGRNAFSVLRCMAARYKPPADSSRERHRVASISSGLPSGMGRTWLTFPQVPVPRPTRSAL